MAGGWLCIVTDRPNGTPYIGVTSDLARRTWEHRTGAVPGFTRRYGLKRLVFPEQHPTMPLAVQREKTMKHWPRAWKVNLTEASNPTWQDLYDRFSARSRAPG